MQTPSNSGEDADSIPATQTLAKPVPARRKMSMAFINVWLDAGLLFTVAFVGWVTAMLQVVFPAPTSADGWVLWGLSFDQWRDAQFFSLCLFAGLVLVHVMLHWNWVCSVIATQVLRRNRPDSGMQTIYGVAILIVLLNLIVGGIIVAILTVKSPPY